MSFRDSRSVYLHENSDLDFCGSVGVSQFRVRVSILTLLLVSGAGPERGFRSPGHIRSGKRTRSCTTRRKSRSPISCDNLR